MRRLAGEVFSERNNGRRFCCLAENGWKQWKMNVAERMEGGRGKQEQNREQGSEEGSEKAAAARVERFAFLSSFLPSSPFFPFCTLACLPDGAGEIPPLKTVPELLNSASPSSPAFELHLRCLHKPLTKANLLHQEALFPYLQHKRMLRSFPYLEKSQNRRDPLPPLPSPSTPFVAAKVSRH